MKYRTESFGGSMVRDAADVIMFETFELDNTDILEYLANGILKNHPIAARMLEMADAIGNGTMDDISDNTCRMFVDNVLAVINEETGKDIKYALWLADKANVWRYWLACNNASCFDNEVLEKDVPEDFLEQSDIVQYDETKGIVLSDLDDDGMLYGFEVYPEKIVA